MFTPKGQRSSLAGEYLNPLINELDWIDEEGDAQSAERPSTGGLQQNQQMNGDVTTGTQVQPSVTPAYKVKRRVAPRRGKS